MTFGGKTVADTTHALTMQESTYSPVFYIPRSDAQMALFERTDHTSYCPYKGEAGYFSLVVDGKRAENAVWTYEAPYPGVAEIKNHLAFYPGRVDAIEER